MSSGPGSPRLISNAGQLVKAIGRVRDLMRHRYGQRRCPPDHATDVYRVVAILEDAAAAAMPTFVRDLRNWSEKYLRLDAAAKAEVRAELRDHPPIAVTPRWLGEQLGLTDAERTAVKFWDAEPIDVADPDQARRDRAAARARAGRKRKGATSRSECLARKLEQQPGVAKSTFYDQEARRRQPEFSSHPRGAK